MTGTEAAVRNRVEPLHILRDALPDDLLKRLRATKEWEYVAREVDVRLVRA